MPRAVAHLDFASGTLSGQQRTAFRYDAVTSASIIKFGICFDEDGRVVLPQMQLRQALAPPATLAQVKQVEQHIGIELPEDLQQWWQLCGGLSEHGRLDAGHLLPYFYDPYGPQRALARWQAAIQVSAQLVPSFPEGFDQYIDEQEQQPAGSPCVEAWLDHWMPVAGGSSSNALLVDLRSGPLRGCILEYDRVSGFSQSPIWPNVTMMLHSVAESLQRQSLLRYSMPMVVNGRLTWELT